MKTTIKSNKLTNRIGVLLNTIDNWHGAQKPATLQQFYGFATVFQMHTQRKSDRDTTDGFVENQKFPFDCDFFSVSFCKLIDRKLISK